MKKPHLKKYDPVLEKLIAEGRVTDPNSPKGKLLKTAAHLFNTKGYEQTSIRDLAKAVGRNHSTLFHYFISKEEILRSIMYEIMLYSNERGTAYVPEDTLQGKLLGLIKAELYFIYDEITRDAYGIATKQLNKLPPKTQKYLLSLREDYEKRWQHILEEAYKKKLTSIPAFFLRRFLRGALIDSFSWYNPEGKVNLDELAQMILKLAFK